MYIVASIQTTKKDNIQLWNRGCVQVDHMVNVYKRTVRTRYSTMVRDLHVRRTLKDISNVHILYFSARSDLHQVLKYCSSTINISLSLSHDHKKIWDNLVG